MDWLGSQQEIYILPIIMAVFIGIVWVIFYLNYLCTRQKNHPHPIFIGLGVKKLTNCRNTVLSLLKNTK